MKIHYREHEHAVTTNDRYGYYRQLEYNSIRCGQVLIETKAPSAPPNDAKKQTWPITLYFKMTIHNHEDLTRMTDRLLQAVDELRGEFGEYEVVSPSSWKLPGDWRHLSIYNPTR